MNKQKLAFLILAGIAAIALVFLGFGVILRSLNQPAGLSVEVTSSPASNLPTTAVPPTDTQAHQPSETQTPSNQVPSPTLTPEATAGPGEYFVSPQGSPQGDGSLTSPWDLQTALNHPAAVQPGDTIWVMGGQYPGSFTILLKGEAERPIIVRAAPGERAILDGTVKVLTVGESAHTWFWGLEITNSQNLREITDRPGPNDGVFVDQRFKSSGIKFINMIVHDMAGMGFGFWRTAQDAEIYGSLIYYNGVNQFDHGVYSQNLDGEKRIIDNIIFDNASHGISAYGSEDAYLNNFTIEGNTVFNNGSIGFNTVLRELGMKGRNILLGGESITRDSRVVSNFTYLRTGNGTAFNLGYRAGFENVQVKDNYFIGGSVVIGGSQKGLAFDKNHLFAISTEGIALFSHTNNTWLVARPNQLQTFVRPNAYEPGRANLTIYNWEEFETVNITADQLSGVNIQPGDAYELHNVQNYYEDVISGVYDGNAIPVPMTGHISAVPTGMNTPPPDNFPRFGVFVLTILPGTTPTP